MSERALLLSLLGDLPDHSRTITARRVGGEERELFVLERLVLDLNGEEAVPACFVRPRLGDPPFPVVLYNHAHGGDYTLGKEELVAGRRELWEEPYAVALAREGVAALAIDHWNFGERSGRTESELFKELIWRGVVLWGRMVFDSLRALDYLQGRADVDASRVATLGMSMGSTMAWWVGALDERIGVVVDICCMTDFDALIARRGLDGHGIYYYVPGLLKHFTTARIQSLISPRPHLSLAGDLDPLTPPEGLDRIDREVRQVYARAGRPDAWRLSRYPVGHTETLAMRAEALDFIRRHL